MLIPSSLLLLAAAVAALPQEGTQARAASAVDTSTLKGKWLYGYQGWFRKPAAGVNNHWSPNGGTPGPGNVEIDFFPDTSQYPANCLFDTGFTLPGGATAKLYDNTCDGVVDLHFKLMQQAGVDGVLVQRFLSAIGDSSFITVLNQVRTAAEKYGLGFVVEYDVSGANSASTSAANTVVSDYNNIIKPYTSSKSYIHQNGKPVVMIYGVGYTANKLSSTDATNLINNMKSAGAYVGIGTPTQWAGLVTSNSAWAPALKAANLISPWTVGAYSNGGYRSGYFTTQQSDVQLVKSFGIDYAPVIWPGTSAYHLNGVTNPSAFDYFPRFNGSFYTTQANSVMSLDPMFIFTAMFDEVNEGTGSYPVLKVNQLPTNEKFVGIDNDFSDTNHYLELGGQLAATFHAQQ
ncbi:hypothetical protein F5884DRAFT_786503 [Xylogone sp. PMI_703]|nr:hypothetical protein F5884DRAFT_786503 [Xylogone sp. PMI_703]